MYFAQNITQTAAVVKCYVENTKLSENYKKLGKKVQMFKGKNLQKQF